MFVFHLCRVVLGTLDVDGVMARIPMRTIVEWRKYYEMSPFGDDWQQAATVAAASMNPHVHRPRNIEDFIPKFRKAGVDWTDPKEQERTVKMMDAYAAVHNARLNK
jgi:hypothetical protein